LELGRYQSPCDARCTACPIREDPAGTILGSLTELAEKVEKYLSLYGINEDSIIHHLGWNSSIKSNSLFIGFKVRANRGIFEVREVHADHEAKAARVSPQYLDLGIPRFPLRSIWRYMSQISIY
jgi:hypothetical protein